MGKVEDFIETAFFDDFAQISELKLTMSDYLTSFALFYESLGGSKSDLTILEILKIWNYE